MKRLIPSIAAALCWLMLAPTLVAQMRCLHSEARCACCCHSMQKGPQASPEPVLEETPCCETVVRTSALPAQVEQAAPFAASQSAPAIVVEQAVEARPGELSAYGVETPPGELATRLRCARLCTFLI